MELFTSERERGWGFTTRKVGFESDREGPHSSPEITAIRGSPPASKCGRGAKNDEGVCCRESFLRSTLQRGGHQDPVDKRCREQ